MTDVLRLTKIIKESGLKFNFIAEKCNLTSAGLRNKVDGKRQFTAGEVGALKDLLGLSLKDVDEIFLR